VRPHRARWEAAARWPGRPQPGGALPRSCSPRSPDLFVWCCNAASFWCTSCVPQASGNEGGGGPAVAAVAAAAVAAAPRRWRLRQWRQARGGDGCSSGSGPVAAAAVFTLAMTAPCWYTCCAHPCELPQLLCLSRDTVAKPSQWLVAFPSGSTTPLRVGAKLAAPSRRGWAPVAKLDHMCTDRISGASRSTPSLFPVNLVLKSI